MCMAKTLSLNLVETVNLMCSGVIKNLNNYKMC